MKVTLYDHAYETLAIQYLSATLKEQGFDTEVYYDLSMDKDYLDQDLFLTPFFSLTPEQAAAGILRTHPDVVGFSILTVYYPNLRKIMRCLKESKPDLVLVCGGPHCNLAADRVLENPDVDFLFRGDADISLPAFLRDLGSHSPDQIKAFSLERMPGVSSRVNGDLTDRGLGPNMTDLDAAPFPDKEDYYRKNPSLKILYTMTCSRGCLFKCTYCNSNNLKKIYKECGQKYYRCRSVDSVIAELRLAKARYKPKYIMFLDNLFAPKASWLKTFAEAYRREIGLPFFCETNPNVHSRETMDLLADAGCWLLQFGFQSASEQVRREILHRNETNDRLRELISHAKARGMFVCVDHIANLPGETTEHLDEAIELYRELRPNWINLGFLQYYPQAEIIEIALARRAITTDDLEPIMTGEGQTSFRLVSKSDLSEAYRTFPMRLFCAFKMPRRLGDWILRRIENPAMARIMSPFASVFIYGSRIFCAFTDRRDFLVRHHVIRSVYVMRGVLKERLFGR